MAGNSAATDGGDRAAVAMFARGGWCCEASVHHTFPGGIAVPSHESVIARLEQHRRRHLRRCL